MSNIVWYNQDTNTQINLYNGFEGEINLSFNTQIKSLPNFHVNEKRGADISSYNMKFSRNINIFYTAINNILGNIEYWDIIENIVENTLIHFLKGCYKESEIEFTKIVRE